VLTNTNSFKPAKIVEIQTYFAVLQFLVFVHTTSLALPANRRSVFNAFRQTSVIDFGSRRGNNHWIDPFYPQERVMNRRHLLRLGMLMMVLAAVCVGLGVSRARAEMKNAAVGDKAPWFRLPGSDDEKHSLEDFKGKIVVIHFEAVNCPWDQAYQPILNKVCAEYGKDVVFIGINSNSTETMEDVKGIIKKDDIPYLVLKDAHNNIADAYGAQTTPHIFIVDAKGILRYKGGVEKAPTTVKGVGQSSEQYLVPVLKALIAGDDPPVTETKSKGCSIKRE
jgi:peroxiredoxin